MDYPIYLGKDISSSDRWVFFALKDGVGRFIQCVAYPFWASGAPGQLDVTVQPPPEILEEVRLFVQGKVRYDEVVSKTKKRKRTKIVRVALEGVGDGRRDVGGRNISTEPRLGIPDRPSDVGNTSPKSRRGRPRKVPPGSDLPKPNDTITVAPTTKGAVQKKPKLVRRKK